MPIRNEKGQFIKGQHYSLGTEFKKGEHWRNFKPFWNKEWLYNEYVSNERSALDIAKEFNLTDSAILFWLHKYEIKTREMSEIRGKKYWGSPGDKNGMFGKTGDQNPRWLGGLTQERQSVYSSIEWANISKFIWKRDKGECQKCHSHKNGNKMNIHHIVSFAVEKLRLEPSNLILLCSACHRWVHSKKNKNKEFIKKEVQE